MSISDIFISIKESSSHFRPLHFWMRTLYIIFLELILILSYFHCLSFSKWKLIFGDIWAAPWLCGSFFQVFRQMFNWSTTSLVSSPQDDATLGRVTLAFVGGAEWVLDGLWRDYTYYHTYVVWNTTSPVCVCWLAYRGIMQQQPEGEASLLCPGHCQALELGDNQFLSGELFLVSK